MCMGHRPRRVPYNQWRENGDSVVRSIEPFALEKLDLEPGDAPDDVWVNEDEGELILSF